MENLDFLKKKVKCIKCINLLYKLYLLSNMKKEKAVFICCMYAFASFKVGLIDSVIGNNTFLGAKT